MNLPEYDPTFDPVERFEDLKIPVISHTLHNAHAIWVPERYEHGMVLLNRNIPPWLVRPTLAHEHAHVANGDCGGHHPRNEARANLHSALRLTDPEKWDELTAIHSDYDYICLEIGITRRQFRAYADHRKQKKRHTAKLLRIGDFVYDEPRMGAGQWARKVHA